MAKKRSVSAGARTVKRAVQAFAMNLSAATQSSDSQDVFWGRALLDTVLVTGLVTRRLGPTEDGEILRLVTTLECVECGGGVRAASAFCGDFCKQVARAVRYARKGIADGRSEDLEFHLGLGMKLIQLGHGGYPERERRLKPKLRQAVFERDRRICQLCGEPATEIDHIHGSSGAMANLRAVCGACNWKRALQPDPEASEQDNLEWHRRMAALCKELAVRVAAPEPLKCADDPLSWQRLERATRGARRTQYREYQDDIENAFEDVGGYLAHSMAKDD